MLQASKISSKWSLLQMLLTFHATISRSLLLTYQLICLSVYCLRITSFAFLHMFFNYVAIEEKKHNSDTKHITLQDQTYCFNYLIARKLWIPISLDKILLLFHSIVNSCPKVALVLQWGWRQIVQQDMNLFSVSHFIF